MFEHLNAEQLAAAEFDGGRLRILAGAGTGKTTALTSRVARLVSSGIRAERVMLLTFTRRAAREMVSRVDTGSARVIGGTFHSVAHRTLRRHAAAVGLPEGFSVLDPSDAADVMDLVRLDRMDDRVAGRRFPRKATLLDLYSRAVNTQRPLSEVIDEVAPWCSDRVGVVSDICRDYVARKRSHGLLDFDDLLLYWRAAARDDRIGPSLAGELEHICVDEYQDVNALQVDILAALCADHPGGAPNLTVVGDDSQAVYGFRGSSPRHLLDIAEVFPDISTIVLEQNHRSSQPILDLANAVGADAPEGFSTRRRSVRSEGHRPQVLRCADEDAQVDAVCERILAHREEGIALSSQAVLVRAAHHSALLEIELSRRGIPYVKYGGLRFLEAAHVKDLICLFRLADNPCDVLSWFRLLQLLEGVGPATARRCIDALGVVDDEPVVGGEAEVLLRWPLASELLPRASRVRADALVEALRREPGEAAGAHAERLAAALTPLIRDAYENADERLADLEALVASAHDAVRVSDVAADLVLEPPQSTSDLAGRPVIDEDWLVISTVHSAKGLEWEVVHLLNAADGCFPSDMALGHRDGLEEERRLFYVAATRPSTALHIYHPVRFHHRPRGRDDVHLYGQPSRFLGGSVSSTFDSLDVSHVEELVDISVGAGGVVELELDQLWR